MKPKSCIAFLIGILVDLCRASCILGLFSSIATLVSEHWIVIWVRNASFVSAVGCYFLLKMYSRVETLFEERKKKCDSEREKVTATKSDQDGQT